MRYEHLTILASLYAASINRSLMTVAARVGVHNRTFVLLSQGKGCHFDTFCQAMAWFDENWPADLDWPADVPRPSATIIKRKGRTA